jgi:hypothetical protein
MFGRLAAVNRYQNAFVHGGLEEFVRTVAAVPRLDCRRSQHRGLDLAVNNVLAKLHGKVDRIVETGRA